MNFNLSKNLKPLTIISFFLTICSLLFSLIPCIGFYAIFPSCIAILLCLISFFYLQKTYLSLIGLFIGFIAILISVFQYYEYKIVFDTKSKIDKSIYTIEKSIKDNITKNIKQEIKEKALENFEKIFKKDSIKKPKNDSL
ncbi:conserved membrane hypothetical protein [Tenacibaculum maritimum]|nr:conserved membrane hypothetical protein [Tenacibaculum maritimum]